MSAGQKMRRAILYVQSYTKFRNGRGAGVSQESVRCSTVSTGSITSGWSVCGEKRDLRSRESDVREDLGHLSGNDLKKRPVPTKFGAMTLCMIGQNMGRN